MVVSLKQVQDVTHATKATLPRFSWNEKKKLRRRLCWTDAKLYPVSFCRGEEGPSHFSGCPPSTWSLRLMSWGRITVSPENIQRLKVEGKYGVWDFFCNHWTFSVISHWMGNELRSLVSSVLCSLMQNSRNTFFNVQKKQKTRERETAEEWNNLAARKRQINEKTTSALHEKQASWPLSSISLLNIWCQSMWIMDGAYRK